MDRQAQKAIMFGLNYGMAGGSSFMRMLIEEQIKMMASMAVARNTGIGYICLEHTDFTDIESRLLLSARELKMALHHDEAQVEFITHDIGPRGYSKNQRGRHWERTRQVEVKAVPKTAQQLLDEDFANDNPSRLVHQMAEVRKAPHLKSIACKIVEAGGKIELQKNTWYSWFNGDYKDYSF